MHTITATPPRRDDTDQDSSEQSSLAQRSAAQQRTEPGTAERPATAVRPVGPDASERALRLAWDRPDVERLAPPTDDVKYSLFAVRRRWPLLWLFGAQMALMAGFVAVMVSSALSLVGLVLLAVTVPFALWTAALALSRPGHDLEDHVVFVEKWRKRRSDVPTVDVFISWERESVADFADLALAVHDLQWPGRVTVHVLDHDAATTVHADAGERRRAAVANGFTYWRAEALRSASDRGFTARVLARTAGDLVLHLRPGTAPRADFLWETVPALQDERVGVVQAAEHVWPRTRSDLDRFATALRDVFHRWVQPDRDRHGMAASGRSGALYRRSVLGADVARGIDTLGSGPRFDVALHARGFTTRQVPVVLSAVRAPASWRDAIGEQYALGCERAELTLTRAVAHARLTRRQRSQQRAALLLYVASAVAPLAVALPVLAMLWLHPALMRADDFAVALPAVAALLIVLPALSRSWRPSLARHFATMSVTHLVALVDSAVAWVLSVGGRRRRSRLPGIRTAPRRVAVTGLALLTVTQGLFWVGVARYIGASGTAPDVAAFERVALELWPVLLLALAQVAVLAPTFIRLACTTAPEPARRAERRTLSRSRLEIAA